MSELARSVGLLSMQQVVLMLLGAARTKFAASLLGPAGMGILAQAASFQDLLRQVTMLGASNGFLKLVAEYHGRDDRRALERLIVTTMVLFGGIAVAIAALSVAFAAPLASAVFDDPTLAPYIVLAALGLLVLVPGTLVGRIFSGTLQFRSYVQLSVFDSFTGLVAMATLVWLYGLDGAVVSFVVVEVVALAFGLVLLWRRVVRPLGLDLTPRAPDGDVIRRLLRFAGALSLTSMAAAGSALFVRGEIIRRYGPEANGYYQVAWQVGQNYLGILGASLWTYGMPKVASKIDDPAAVLELQNDFLRIALSVLAPGIVLLLCARELWVPILYSGAFLAAGPMLGWQLGGELTAMLRQSMNISLLPRERLGFLVFQATFYWGGWVLLSLLLLPHLGAIGVAVGYCLANVLALIVTWIYHRGVLGYRVRSDNVRLLAVTVPGFVLAVVLSSGDDLVVARALPLALVAIWLLWNRRFFLDALAASGFARRGGAG